MAYRFEVQYWTYEQACELPFGVPCCRSKEGLSEPLDERRIGHGKEEPMKNLDTWSSASRQHFIDTGHYLKVGEALAAGSDDFDYEDGSAVCRYGHSFSDHETAGHCCEPDCHC